MNAHRALRVEKLDYIEEAPAPGPEASRTEERLAASWKHHAVELRRRKRVPVGLRASVVLDRENVFDARTVDISESGVLIHGYGGPALREGRLIGVTLRGLLSDASRVAGDDLYVMRVVRHDGERLALDFPD